MANFTHYTANDITPNRCTITGCYESETAAREAIETDDQSQYFCAASTGDASDMTEGTRAYHRDGVCWRA